MAKWKSLRERYNNIIEKLQKDGSVKRSQWPYFERMNAILGFDDTVRLQYVESRRVRGRSRPEIKVAQRKLETFV
jgi:uncharacterized protein YmfQ (DUF2313 family)